MGKPIRIIADDKIPFLKGVLEPVAEISYLPGSQIRTSDLAQADGLITRTRTRCDRNLLEGTPLKFIATATIGFDHIDADWCAEAGIEWTNAPGCNASSVQQYMASVLMTLGQREGWTLPDKTIGIIGVGYVGSRVEKICRALGMRVLLNDPPRARIEGEAGFVSLGQILDQADIISLHVPLNPEGEDATLHLVNDGFLAKMRKGAWLLNSSRGRVVESKALKRSLESGHLGGAVLDVFEGEPDMDVELLARCAIATPHIAGYSTDGKATGTAMSVQALSRFFGLGLDDWFPGDLPEPDPVEIILDGTGKTWQEACAAVILQTYDVMCDDAALRENPAHFEALRGNYPVRREPPAYKLTIENDEAGAFEILRSFGYGASVKPPQSTEVIEIN